MNWISGGRRRPAVAKKRACTGEQTNSKQTGKQAEHKQQTNKQTGHNESDLWLVEVVRSKIEEGSSEEALTVMV